MAECSQGEEKGVEKSQNFRTLYVEGPLTKISRNEIKPRRNSTAEKNLNILVLENDFAECPPSLSLKANIP